MHYRKTHSCIKKMAKGFKLLQQWGKAKIFLLALCASLFAIAPVFGQSHGFDQVRITTVQVADGIYMLMGKGGNIGVSAGEDGVFLIDDQFAPLTAKIRTAIGKISRGPIGFVLNTHWHFDHVGGNENLGEGGTVIVAHENVRKRLSSDQFIEFFQKKVPATSKPGLPVITFTRDIRFHLNGETLEVFHVKDAHTDGDAAVYFKKANVVHTGDVYFAGINPFIDTGSHGSVNGMIWAGKRILAMIDEDTKVIPGHGPLSNKAELEDYVSMLSQLRDAISNAIAKGQTLEEVQAGKPTRAFDPEWGDGFLSPEKFVQILYTDLSRDNR